MDPAAAEGMKVVLPREYPLILLACAIICAYTFIISIVLPVPARRKYFTKEFMAQFKEEHEKAFPGSEPAEGGWPDAGDGRYAQKLDYADWVKFNNVMRAHLNQVE